MNCTRTLNENESKTKFEFSGSSAKGKKVRVGLLFDYRGYRKTKKFFFPVAIRLREIPVPIPNTTVKP